MHDVERNLLFALLALQNAFLDPADLGAVWNRAMGHDLIPIDDLLLKEGLLSNEDRTLLDGLVHRVFNRNGQDLARSLQSLSRCTDIAAALNFPDDDASSLPPIPAVDLPAPREDLPTAEPIPVSSGGGTLELPTEPTDLYASGDTWELPTLSESVPIVNLVEGMLFARRYRIRRLLARSGWNANVYFALDTVVNRDVTLRIFSFDPSLEEWSRRRCEHEAEHLATLQHPGIAPVYDFGWFGATTFHFVTKYIEGQRLKDLIDEMHTSPMFAFENPSIWRPMVWRLMARFKAVCETVAYAHDRGVVHRALTSSEILLGRFGETYVEGWEAGTPRLEPEEEAGLAGANALIGVIGYVAPEAMQGENVAATPAGDVFSLGAILYEILTNARPYPGATVIERLERMRQGNIVPPGQVNPRLPIPRALEAVVLKATARLPADRYPSASELGKDIDSWLADAPVSVLPSTGSEKDGRRGWFRREPRTR